MKMSKLYLYVRSLPGKANFAAPGIKFTQERNFSNKSEKSSSSSSSGSSGSSSSTSDDEQKTLRIENERKHSEVALKKLNDLLFKMMQEIPEKSNKASLDLAKPKGRFKIIKEEEGVESVKFQSAEKQMVNAVKDVAKTMGGDVKKTESELLLKLLNTDYKLTSLSEIVKGLQVEKNEKPRPRSRAMQVRQILSKTERTDFAPRQRQQWRPREFKKIDENINLYGNEPLGIFKKDENTSEGVVNKTWEFLSKREMKLAVTHPPSNYFQEMIQWTEQGKIWKFPIDNEQGLDEEQKIFFTEHVFLDKHLQAWCPPKGPIRHFMELVCVGLSKNPYLTVEAKKEHIEWFRDFFVENKKLLQDTGALQGHNLEAEPKLIEK